MKDLITFLQEKDARIIITEKVIHCFKNGNWNFIGDSLSKCTEKQGLSDLDNSFLASIAYGGLVGAFSFLMLVLNLMIAISRMPLDTKSKLVMILSFFILLNIDVIFNRPTIFFPLIANFYISQKYK